MFSISDDMAIYFDFSVHDTWMLFLVLAQICISDNIMRQNFGAFQMRET